MNSEQFATFMARFEQLLELQKRILKELQEGINVFQGDPSEWE